ncbi:ribonuclease E inhibitor RraB [Dactylosporangium cerinum]
MEFLAYFPATDHAEAAAEDLRNLGFAVTVERGDEADFILQAIRRDAVEPPALHEVTWEVRGVVERHDGVYDGWGCMVQA